jgi:valyl-tRNA synthetase
MSKGKKLAHKLRNAVRFVAINQTSAGTNEAYLKEWQIAKQQFIEHMDGFQYPVAIAFLTQFFWNRVCDVFIEDCKKSPCFHTINIILNDIVSLYEIFLPGITQDIKAYVLEKPAPQFKNTISS